MSMFDKSIKRNWLLFRTTKIKDCTWNPLIPYVSPSLKVAAHPMNSRNIIITPIKSTELVGLRVDIVFH